MADHTYKVLPAAETTADLIEETGSASIIVKPENWLRMSELLPSPLKSPELNSSLGTQSRPIVAAHFDTSAASEVNRVTEGAGSPTTFGQSTM